MLLAQDGVEEAQVNFADNSVSLVYDNEKLTKEDFSAGHNQIGGAIQELLQLRPQEVWVVRNGEELKIAFVCTVSVLVIACPCALGLATPTALAMAFSSVSVVSNSLYLKFKLKKI